jgi:hypothetical protein
VDSPVTAVARPSPNACSIFAAYANQLREGAVAWGAERPTALPHNPAPLKRAEELRYATSWRGRPKVDVALERKAQKQLNKGVGILKVAKMLGVGNGTVRGKPRHRVQCEVRTTGAVGSWLRGNLSDLPGKPPAPRVSGAGAGIRVTRVVRKWRDPLPILSPPGGKNWAISRSPDRLDPESGA